MFSRESELSEQPFFFSKRKSLILCLLLNLLEPALSRRNPQSPSSPGAFNQMSSGPVIGGGTHLAFADTPPPPPPGAKV